MKTFLENLKKELTKLGFNEETIAEILNDHKEMMQLALDEGLEESKITEKFGDPEKIAKELKDIEPDSKNKNNEYKLIKSFDQETINKFFIKLISEDLKLEISNSNQFEIYGKRVKLNKYNIEVESECLTIEKKNEKTFGLFSFSSGSAKFIIKVPHDKTLKEIDYKATSGDFEFSNLTSENLKIKNVSGDIEAKTIKATNFYIKTVSGDVELKQSEIKELTISIVSGDIDMDLVVIIENLKINSVSGDTNINSCESKEFIYNSVSGDFEAKEYYPKNANLKSVTGDIEFKNKDKDKNINVVSKKTLRGEIKI